MEQRGPLRTGFWPRRQLTPLVTIAAVSIGILSACSGTAVEETIDVFVADGPPEDMTNAEVGERLAACAADLGLEVTIDAEGGVSYERPENESPGRFIAVMEDCESALEGRGEIPSDPERTPEFLDEEYDRLLLLAECVVAQGHDIKEPTTREDFIASAGWNWHPYMLLGELGPADFAEINELCPQDLRIE